MGTMPFSQCAVLRGDTEVVGQDTFSVTKGPAQFHEAHGSSIFLRLLLLLPPLTLALVSTNGPTSINILALRITTDPEHGHHSISWCPRRITIEASCFVWLSGWYALNSRLAVKPTKLIYYRYHSLGIWYDNHRDNPTDCISSSVSHWYLSVLYWELERFKIPLFIPWKSQKYYTRFRILWKRRSLWCQFWQLRARARH